MPVARRMARTSISGAMSGAASGLAAICRAMSASVIPSSRSQSVADSASRAASLDLPGISLHLSRIGLAKGNHSALRAAIDMDANEQPRAYEAEGDLSRLSI